MFFRVPGSRYAEATRDTASERSDPGNEPYPKTLAAIKTVTTDNLLNYEEKNII